MRDFVRKIRHAEPALAAELKTGLKQIAEVVSETARPSLPSRSGNLRNTLRPFATFKTSEVKMGGAKAPYGGFIEYGNKVRGGRGAVGRGDSVPRQFVKQGRYLRPAYEQRRAQVEIEALQVIDRLAERLD